MHLRLCGQLLKDDVDVAQREAYGNGAHKVEQRRIEDVRIQRGPPAKANGQEGVDGADKDNDGKNLRGAPNHLVLAPVVTRAYGDDDVGDHEPLDKGWVVHKHDHQQDEHGEADGLGHAFQDAFLGRQLAEEDTAEGFLTVVIAVVVHVGISVKFQMNMPMPSTMKIQKKWL